MDCEWVVFLMRNGEEIKHHRFHAPTPEEAVEKSDEFAKAEWRERQMEFPFTPELPADVILFRCFREWGYVDNRENAKKEYIEKPSD